MTDESIPFWKLTAAGNDFVCFDNRDGRFDRLIVDTAAGGHFARTVCRRNYGVGADGVIFACLPETPDTADFGASHFESDGSPCELCGNGSACFTRFVIDEGFVPDRDIRFLTPAGVVRGRRAGGQYIRVCIPSPEDHKLGMQLDLGNAQLDCDYVVTGVPHVVTYVDDLASTDVANLGFALRHHEAFRPRGVNANFVQVLGEGEIAVRTFEFGVEGETLSCGTGSAAAAILATLRFGWDGGIRSHEKPVLIHSRSGEILRVYFIADGQQVTEACLETVVRRIMHGRLNKEFAAGALATADADR